jgi:hypothetical protein
MADPFCSCTSLWHSYNHPVGGPLEVPFQAWRQVGVQDGCVRVCAGLDGVCVLRGVTGPGWWLLDGCVR